MWTIDLQSWETCETVVKDYATGFASYGDACEYGNALECIFRPFGLMYAVRRASK